MARRPLLLLLVGLAVVLVSLGGRGAARSANPVGSLSSTPDATYVTDGSVEATARAGSTIYIGGDFSEVGPRTGPFAAIDSSTAKPQANLPEVSGGQALVAAIAADGTGGWYLGGDFTHVGGVARHNLAHILANGSVDSSFNPGANGEVFTLLFFGGALDVGGTFTSIAGQSRSYLAQLDTNGSATTWNPAPNDVVRALVVVKPIGVNNPATIFVGGNFTSIGGQARSYLARLNLNGTATVWDPEPNGDVWAIAATGGGLSPLQIDVGGVFTTIDGGQTRNRIAQLDGNGHVTGFDANAGGIVESLAASGSTVYAGGNFTTIGGQSRNSLAALDSTTGEATSWNPNATVNSDVLALGVSGTTLYAGGDFTSLGGATRERLAALDTATAAATPWNPDANQEVRAIALSGTTVAAGGFFSSVGGVARSSLAAIDAATGKPTSWNPGTDGAVNSLAVANGVVYAGGGFDHAGGASRADLVALNGSTGAATAWNPSPDNAVVALAISGGTIYAGGFFTSIGGQSRGGIAALDTATGKATGWNPNADGWVDAVALLNGTIYAGGQFSTIGGTSRVDLAALDPTTGLATAWDPGPNGIVRALATSGSTLYFGGDFTHVGPYTRDHLAAISAAGVMNAWNPSVNGPVYAVAVGGSTVYAGGDFSSIGATPRAGLGAISAATGSAASWNPAPTAVRALEADPDGSVYVGGAFRTMDLAPQQGFASFSLPPASSAAPAIGALQVGQPTTCSKGSWSGSTPQTYTYVWLRDGAAIGAATAATYTPLAGDRGHELSCRVTATNVAGSASAVSASVLVPQLMCVVPKLKGKTLKAAKRVLRAANCSLGKVGKAYSAKIKKGRVVSQKPKPHTVKPLDARVKLVLSRGRKR